MPQSLTEDEEDTEWGNSATITDTLSSKPPPRQERIIFFNAPGGDRAARAHVDGSAPGIGDSGAFRHMLQDKSAFSVDLRDPIGQPSPDV
jgi:hypothetical protein